MPLPVKLLNDEIIFTDGHTRAFVLWKNGVKKIEVYWESEDEDLFLSIKHLRIKDQ